MGLIVAQDTARRTCARRERLGHNGSSLAPVGDPPPQPSSISSPGDRCCTRLTSISESTM